MKYLRITLLVLMFSGDIKEKKSSEKKSSENDQLTGHFQSFFIYFFFVPPTLDLNFYPVNQLIKQFWPLKFERIVGKPYFSDHLKR